MLKENIKTLRKSKGLSQEDFASKLNVVRQTVSKWENGLSVPDADMLITTSDVLETSVSDLLGENIAVKDEDRVNEIAEKLEEINYSLAKRKTHRKKILNRILIATLVITLTIAICLGFYKSGYLNWDYSKVDLAVAKTFIHGFEWIFIRVFPFLVIGLIIAIFKTRNRI